MKIKLRLLLLPALSIVSCSSCTHLKVADLIFINGKIITADSMFSVREAVAISGNRILAVGSNSDILQLKGRGTREVDLHGHAVVPGLIDSHLHPESAAVSELESGIPDVRTMDELLGWIREQAGKAGKGNWVIHPKFFPTRLAEMRQPTLSELDKAAPDNPVFLNGSFGGMINSMAMRASGIDSRNNDPGILKDPATGKPTGFIRSSAFPLLSIPPVKSLSEGEYETALSAMIARYNEYGFTSLLSGAGDTASLSHYRDMARRKVLNARICQNILFYPVKPVTKESVGEQIKKLHVVTGDGDDWVRTGSLKVFLDGGILTGTAYMKEPWGRKAAAIYGITDQEYRGVVNYSQDELNIIVSEANSNGWSFTAHATGEAAVEMLLKAYSSADSERSIKNKRFSIIHGNFFNSSSIEQMARMDVYANLQPAWFFKDIRAMDSILGHKKVEVFHPYRALCNSGVMINGGSDHMVKWDATSSINPYNPFLAMWSMVTMKTEDGQVYHPEQALTREEALKAYTINNAYAMFSEKAAGSIEPGKLADLAILDRDILTCPADSIRNIKVLMTILDGKEIYVSPECNFNPGN